MAAVDESVEVAAGKQPEPELAWSSSEEEEDDDGADDAALMAEMAKKNESKGPPRFKSKEEMEAHTKEVEQAALADAGTIARLEEVRARRETARIERDAEAAKLAAIEAELAARAAAGNAEGSQERPTLPLPGPKDMKGALMAMQEAASDAFQKKHGIKGAGGNKLAKVKGAAFKKIFEDFQESAETSELLQYLEEL